MLDYIAGHANYWFFIILMMSGLYIVVSKGNLVKKIVGLNIFQTAVFMFYISVSKVSGGTAAIFPADNMGKIKLDPEIVYSNPLPHVLILTAIVVGVATTSLGLALIIRIREEFDTIEEVDLTRIEQKLTAADNAEHGSGMGGMA